MELLVIPSKVEESRGVAEKQLHGILGLRWASLRMTRHSQAAPRNDVA